MGSLEVPWGGRGKCCCLPPPCPSLLVAALAVPEAVARPSTRPMENIRNWSPPFIPFPGDPVSGDWGAPRFGVTQGQVLGNLRQVTEHTEPQPHDGGQEGGGGRQDEAPSTSPGQGAFAAPSSIYQMD